MPGVCVWWRTLLCGILPFPRHGAKAHGVAERGGTGDGEVEPTDEWEQIELLCGWPEQRDYELIRPLVLFGSPAAERAEETRAVSERTLQRKTRRFEAEGVESLFGSEHARRRRLPPAMRRLIVDLKAEYPTYNLNEISGACHILFGRRPDHKTVRRVLTEDPIPLRIARRFPPYHEVRERRERRLTVVTLHAEGWSSKAIFGYLGVHKSTVHRILKRWPGKARTDSKTGSTAARRA